MEVDPPKLFPYCVVWTPIPFVTWILPFVGHLGICRADGTILDFLGPYFVSVGNFGFGHPTRYWQLDPRRAGAYHSANGKPIQQWWDEELEHSASFFRTLYYSFCGTNCHSFVSFFLNQIDYSGSMAWNTVALALVMFLRGRYVSTVAVVKTWLPFGILASVGAVLAQWTFLYVYLAVMAAAVGYFALLEYAFRAQRRLRDQSSRGTTRNLNGIL